MDERFVSLATYLRAVAPAVARGGDGEIDVPTPPAASIASPATGPSRVVDFAHADIVADLTMMRLAAMEAFERRTRRLIADLAHDVLARELALAPSEIEALVACAVAEFADHEPIALGIAPVDRERVRTPLPLREDPQLVAGDLIVYVRDGAFESPFAFRLADALERNAERGVR